MTRILAAFLLLFPSITHAAGFYIQEQSVSGLGASFAGQAAMPRDSSVLFFNPAGIAHLDGRQVNIGVHMIYPHAAIEDTGTTIGGFTLDQLGRANGDGGNPGSLSPIPNAYFATPLNDDKSWWFGIGLSAPFGLGVEYEDDFFARYLTTKVELRTLDLQPTIAWKPNEFIAVGGTLVFEHVRANFQQKLANEDLVRLQGDDLSMGYNLGIMLTPLSGTRVGLDYRSEINHDAHGRQTTENGTLGLNANASAKIKLPDIATAAIAQDVGDRWTLLGQVSRFGWNNFDTLEVIPESAFTVGPTLSFNYQNTWAYSLGAEFEADENWTFRAGWQYDQTPTTIEGRTAMNPDGDRNWFSGGVTYQWNDRLSLDLAGTYIDIEEERLRQSRAGTVEVRANANDTYVVIGAIGLNYKF